MWYALYVTFPANSQRINYYLYNVYDLAIAVYEMDNPPKHNDNICNKENLLCSEMYTV